MSEEDFKSIRITLSLEAFDRLEKIMKNSKFRSYSSTVEECIRVVYSTIGDIHAAVGKRDAPFKPWNEKIADHTFKTIMTRMERFTGRRYVLEKPAK